MTILRSSFLLIGFRSRPNAFLTMWKSLSSAWLCCLLRNRRNADPTSVTTAGIGAVAAAESAETLGPAARPKYCDRSFWSALLCSFLGSDVFPACWCVDEGSLCSMPNASKVFLVARICCIRFLSSCRMCSIATSSCSFESIALVHGMLKSLHSFRRFFRCWFSWVTTADSHWLHASSHAATG